MGFKTRGLTKKEREREIIICAQQPAAYPIRG